MNLADFIETTLTLVHPSPTNPRKSFPTEEMAEMLLLDFDALFADHLEVAGNGAVLQPVGADFVKHRLTASRRGRGKAHPTC